MMDAKEFLDATLIPVGGGRGYLAETQEGLIKVKTKMGNYLGLEELLNLYKHTKSLEKISQVFAK